jgi:uncharacterized protein (DUF1778 family)
MKKLPSMPPRPETRSVTLSMKVRPNEKATIHAAAKANERSKATVVEFVLEQWLRANGYLK